MRQRISNLSMMAYCTFLIVYIVMRKCIAVYDLNLCSIQTNIYTPAHPDYIYIVHAQYILIRVYVTWSTVVSPFVLLWREYLR